MPLTGYAKVAGDWKELTGKGWVKVSGVWRVMLEDNLKQYMKVEGDWKTYDPVAPPPVGPTPGTYILSPTALYLPDPGTSGYAEFNTSAYRGYINNVQCRITWGSQLIVGITLNISGRHNGNFYRNLPLTQDWDNRTIDHGVSSYDSSAITDFNNGAAIGFNFGGDSNIIGRYMKYAKLKIGVS